MTKFRTKLYLMVLDVGFKVWDLRLRVSVCLGVQGHQNALLLGRRMANHMEKI